MVTWFSIIKTRMINPFIHLILEHVQIHAPHGGQCVSGWIGGLAIPAAIFIVVILVAKCFQSYVEGDKE